MECLNCKSRLIKRYQKKFCSNKCQANYQYQLYIDKWKKGNVSGNRGINTKNISAHIKKYLVNKYGERCYKCGWNKKHFKGYVPLEMDHIDGNSENNKDDNLRLLCPNCHSLTLNFKNLNKGKGRIWRTKKYLINQRP